MIEGPARRAWQIDTPGAFHRGEHVGRGPASAAEAAREPYRVLQRARLRLRITATTATVAGFYLAASLPPLMSAALLFLTPVAFLMSTLRNARMLVDRLALALGLVLGPLFA